MHTFDSAFRRSLLAAAGLAALFACSSRASADVIYQSELQFPQSNQNPITSPGSAWTYSNNTAAPNSNSISTVNHVAMFQNSSNGNLSFPASDTEQSAYSLYLFCNNSSTTPPSYYYITSTAADNFGTFQPDTTYTFTFYAGNRSGSTGWDANETLNGEITDGTNILSSVTLTTSSFAAANQFYQFNVTYTTPDSGGPIGSNVTLELYGIQNDTANAQMIITDPSLDVSAPAPEPTALGIIGLSCIGALGRRRRGRMA